jgi:hypothetical protein
LDIGLHNEIQPRIDTDKHGFEQGIRIERCKFFFISVFIRVNPWLPA